MGKLIFFDKDHTYQVDGVTVPSVSEVLRFMSREIYDTVNQYALDNAADRGSRVHKACENLDRYGSCEVSRDIEPYIRAYMRFRKECEPEWSRVEQAFYHPDLGYAGTLDRYGLIDGRHFIVDIKTNAQIKVPLVTAQLNGYELMAERDGLPVEGLAVLQLRKNGTYRFREIDQNPDTFLACLTLHGALKKKPRKKKEDTNGTAD